MKYFNSNQKQEAWDWLTSNIGNTLYLYSGDSLKSIDNETVEFYESWYVNSFTTFKVESRTTKLNKEKFMEIINHEDLADDIKYFEGESY